MGIRQIDMREYMQKVGLGEDGICFESMCRKNLKICSTERHWRRLNAFNVLFTTLQDMFRTSICFFLNICTHTSNQFVPACMPAAFRKVQKKKKRN